RLAQELDRVGAGERRILRREQRADVLHAGRAENRVGQRMREDVAVGVPRQPARMLDAHAAEHQRDAVLQRVCVEAGTDAELAHAKSSGSCASESTRNASRGGSCRWPHGPRRTCTATRPAASAGATSLSTRSPTYATSAAGRPVASTTRSKKRGD